MAEMQIEATERLGRDAGFSSVARSRSADPRAGSRAQAKHQPTPSVQTESTDHTIRQTPLHQRAASGELTAEEHLEIGIQAHSTGSLTKSTYHLRLAAREGLPTAMLLYALACRHGWGMRPNQEDGVMWLRKAIESSGLQVADVDQTIANASRREGKTDPVAEAAERRKRKAQFGLAVYELGISYMNGWGCQKDKPLALQCYEVAGGWGDCDALAEAGYCYTQGIGCKKDMKKAAGLYRKAADLGMSMAGNSWWVADWKHRWTRDQVTNTHRSQDLQTQVHGRIARRQAQRHVEAATSSSTTASARITWTWRQARRAIKSEIDLGKKEGEIMILVFWSFVLGLWGFGSILFRRIACVLATYAAVLVLLFVFVHIPLFPLFFFFFFFFFFCILASTLLLLFLSSSFFLHFLFLHFCIFAFLAFCSSHVHNGFLLHSCVYIMVLLRCAASFVFSLDFLLFVGPQTGD
jgi:TPR repeat protein